MSKCEAVESSREDGPKVTAVRRLAQRLYTGVEWLVRFSEVMLLAAVFMLAFGQTQNAFLGFLAILLTLAASFYLAEFNFFIFERYFPSNARRWWGAVIIAGLVGVSLWLMYQGSYALTDAISELANAQDL